VSSRETSKWQRWWDRAVLKILSKRIFRNGDIKLHYKVVDNICALNILDDIPSKCVDLHFTSQFHLFSYKPHSFFLRLLDLNYLPTLILNILQENLTCMFPAPFIQMEWFDSILDMKCLTGQHTIEIHNGETFSSIKLCIW